MEGILVRNDQNAGSISIFKARLMIKILIVVKIEDREIMARHKRPRTSLLMLTYGNSATGHAKNAFENGDVPWFLFFYKI